MTTEQKIIRVKVGLLELAKQLGNVSQACMMMGYSRDSFYRFKELYDAGGELALQELTRRKPILKNRIPPDAEAILVRLSLEQPAFGQVRVANELRKRGLRLALRRPFRLAAPRPADHEAPAEGARGQDGLRRGLILTEAQVAALEKAKADKEAHGEFVSECPGYCGAQDTLLRRQHEGGRTGLSGILCCGR